MNRLFRKLPLAAKLILIGLIPLLLLVYLTVEIYHEKNQRLRELTNSISNIHQSSSLSSLIDALQTERKISFDYTLGKAQLSDLLQTRPYTDKFLSETEESNDPNVSGFKEYTSINRLEQVRTEIDSGKARSDAVMHYYSNTIFRLNTLNSIPYSTMLEPVYKDLAAQKLLTEMSTYLGIIRSNIYNVLITRKYMVETLIGITGTHDVYRSYDKEFLVKAPPAVLKEYNQMKNTSDLKLTHQYLDSLFKRFSFDSSLSADQWWTISNNALNELSGLRQKIWTSIENSINSIYENEKNDRNKTLILFLIFLNVVAVLITYTAIVITSMLRDLKKAARKIAKGSTSVSIQPESADAMGSLARSIARIAETNASLASATEAIGNGNFKIKLEPRSEEDVLAHSIIRMKEELRMYSERMEALVRQRTQELEQSNKDLQQFAHVASHDLKEPLRKICTYTERLMIDQESSLSEDSRNYLAKVNQSSLRMMAMIDGILTYSSVSAAKEPFELVDLSTIAETVKTDLELLIEQKNAVVEIRNLPQIEGAPVLLNQLLYNLLNNALKFSRKEVPPVITISCRKLNRGECSGIDSNNCYELSIEDNGIGFDQQYAEHIFDTFSRLHSKNQYEGTGLGLALCKRIIDYHRGKIWAESRQQGSIFKILLPQTQKIRSLVSN